MSDTNETPTSEWRAEAKIRNAERAAIMQRLGLSIASTFIPFSLSRNKGERSPNLNYKITLFRMAKRGDGLMHEDAILTTNYMMGSGHCPAYSVSIKRLGHQHSVMRDEAIRWECERGKPSLTMTGIDHIAAASNTPILPDPLDVMASLLSDSSVIDCGTFEEWARDLGYDTDSRKAEATYRACLEIALKLRNGIGEAGLAELAEAFRDY